MGHSPALLAWLAATVCVVLARRRQQRLERWTPPNARRLLAELTAESVNAAELAEVERRWAIAELNQRLSDVSFELDMVPSTYAALIRICLASGSALAVVGFVISTDEAPLTRAVRLAIAAAAGLAGATGVALFGRAAKQKTRQIRADWDRLSRDIGKALGTSLAGSSGIGGNSFPE